MRDAVKVESRRGDEATRRASSDALALLERVGGAGLVRELIALYLSYAPARLSEAEQAAILADSEGVRRACHALRSGGAQLGLGALAELCASAERAAVSGGELTRVVAEVRRAYERAVGVLAAHHAEREGR